MTSDLLRRLVIDRVCDCDGLIGAVEGISSHSSTVRKVAFAILVYCLKRGLGADSLTSLATKLSYSSENVVFFTGDKSRRSELSYFKEKKVSQNIKNFGKEQVLLYFAPIKFLEEGRVYKMTMHDLERIVSKQNWGSLPDPKACYSWMSVDSAFSPLLFTEKVRLKLPDLSQFSESFPSQKCTKKEEFALTIFKRHNSNTKKLRTSISKRQFSPQANKPSIFQPSPLNQLKRTSNFKLGSLLNSEIEVSNSGISDEQMSFVDMSAMNLCRAKSDYKCHEYI